MTGGTPRRRRSSRKGLSNRQAGTGTPTDREITDDLGDTIDQLHEKLDTAVGRTVDLHRTGAPEEAVLAETAVAVGAAKALELLTGESVESQLEQREEPAGPPASAGRRRWLRRNKDDGQG